jgi:hypothetical protein
MKRLKALPDFRFRHSGSRRFTYSGKTSAPESINT